MKIYVTILLISLSMTVHVGCMAFVAGVQLATRRGLGKEQVRNVIKPYIIGSLFAIAVFLATLMFVFVTDK